MAKYPKERIQQMAKQALRAKQAGDARYELLVLMIGTKTGSHASHIERIIRQLARTGETLY